MVPSGRFPRLDALRRRGSTGDVAWIVELNVMTWITTRTGSPCSRDWLKRKWGLGSNESFLEPPGRWGWNWWPHLKPRHLLLYQGPAATRMPTEGPPELSRPLPPLILLMKHHTEGPLQTVCSGSILLVGPSWGKEVHNSLILTVNKEFFWISLKSWRNKKRDLNFETQSCLMLLSSNRTNIILWGKLLCSGEILQLIFGS